MLALFPPVSVAIGLTVRGGLTPAQLHLTLAEPARDLDPKILGEAAACVAARPPIEARVSGHARFTLGAGDGADVLVALVDAPALERLRGELTAALADRGVRVRADHVFVPHLTLAYLSQEDSLPVERLAPQQVRFSAISTVCGTARCDLPFTGTPRHRLINAHLAHGTYTAAPATRGPVPLGAAP